MHHAVHLFFLMAFYSLCFCCYCIRLTNAAYSMTALTQGRTLEDGQVLESPKRFFVLGFFTGGPLDQRYLGIRLNTLLTMNPVWIANRDHPISDTNGLLSLDHNGVLRLVQDRNNITILNPNPTINNVTATLLDSGNFVLREIYNNASGATGERIVWQSFDYPTDALFPGMKLSTNKSSNTGRTRFLTSWLDDKNPGSGSFTLGLDPNSDQLLIQRRGETYWRSGGWDDDRNCFELAPNLTNADQLLIRENDIKFRYVEAKDERYFAYNYSRLDQVALVWVLNSTGGLWGYRILTDAGYAPVEKLIECQADGSGSDGCEKLKLPSCRTGYEQFQQRRGSMVIEGFPTEEYTGSINDCEIRCKLKCSCIAYAPYDRRAQVGCQFWFTGSRFVEEIGSDYIFYLLSSSHEGKGLHWWLWFIISGSVLAWLLSASLCYLWWRKGKGQESEEDVLLEFGSLSPSQEHGKGGNDQFRLFTHESIVSATDDFSPKNKLGEGGFGIVYKGKLQEQQEIAVKRLSTCSRQGLKEFKNEIALIAKLQHMNLVRLLGCCIKGEEKMLIYEYMPNKSLDSFLFDPAGRQLLDWKKRINIIEGIAQGLVYLHKYSRLRIIHRDLKASNILLDAEMNPKISDFGMARIFARNESAANTNRIVGTYGYMSPEYAMAGIISVKSDVFSYGVLLLEIMSGRRNTSFYNSDHHINLVGYAWDLWQKHVVVELVDPTLLSSSSSSLFSEEIFLRCVHVGLLCVQESAEDRPTMLDVVSMLSNETMSLPQPKQPAFSVVKNRAMEENPEGKPQVFSENGLTMSLMEAR